jgi:phosphatidylglycerol:prolipoprotein diacylglycerol transferase
MLLAISFPEIDPVLVAFGPVAIRWYALAYIAGLLGGWALARRLVAQPALWGEVVPPAKESLDDLLVHAAFGVILGGRLGYALFYNPEVFLANPLEIFMLWQGGMSFHGGLAGAALGLWLFARRNGLRPLAVADLCAVAAPIGIFLGRLANFIKPELWGRPSDVAWAIVFPGAGPLPRHPSQLYEAALEGLVLFAVLMLVVRAGGLRRTGLITGLFGAGYGLARIVCEFFREPDPQLGFLFGGATMGMLLSAPLLLAGAALAARALRASAPELRPTRDARS